MTFESTNVGEREREKKTEEKTGKIERERGREREKKGRCYGHGSTVDTTRRHRFLFQIESAITTP